MRCRISAGALVDPLDMDGLMPRIHILGASGSGTTTLGAALAAELAIPHEDADRYFWKPTNPPFTETRPVEERLALLSPLLPENGDWIFSGSATGWGAPLEPRFTLVVFVKLDPALRMERLRLREQARYGARIEPGGDLEKASREFLDWAASYDEGGLDQRSLALHERWLAARTCPVLKLDSVLPAATLLEAVIAALRVTP
jgi:adenylate kinase family enzyme